MRTSLVITPTPETLQRVQDIVQGTVLQLNGHMMNVEVVASDTSPPPVWATKPDAMYTDLKVKDVQIDTQIATGGAVTRLVAWCESAQLNKRRQELMGFGFNVEAFPWVLLYDVTPGRSMRLTIAHLTDILVYREAPFSFSDEMLLQV